METVIQQLEQKTEAIAALDSAITAKNEAMQKQTEALALAETKATEATAKLEEIAGKFSIMEKEFEAMKQQAIEKDEKIKGLVAKVEMLPEVSAGTKAVADGTCETNQTDYLAEYKSIKDSKQAGIYFKAHRNEILNSCYFK